MVVFSYGRKCERTMFLWENARKVKTLWHAKYAKLPPQASPDEAPCEAATADPGLYVGDAGSNRVFD